MNIAQQLITIATMLVSVHTAIGVLLHDTSMDKAFTASWEYVYYDKSDADEAKMPETNPHTHPEHAQVSHILKNGSSQPRTTLSSAKKWRNCKRSGISTSRTTTAR